MLYSYEDSTAQPCRGCGQGFRADQKNKVFAKRRWHISCFRCQGCEARFKGSFRPKVARGLPFCIDCVDSAKIENCGECGTPLGQEILKVQGIHKKFHPECFRCSACAERIQQSFQKRKGFILCQKCCRKSQKDIENMVIQRKEEYKAMEDLAADFVAETDYEQYDNQQDSQNQFLGSDFQIIEQNSPSGVDFLEDSSSDDDMPMGPPRDSIAACVQSGDFCSSCSQPKVKPSAKFCVNCGYKFT